MKSTAQNAYEITLGDAVASSDARKSKRQLLRLQVDLDMDGPSAACLIELGDSDAAPPKPGDPVEVKLDVGEGMQSIFTGTVDRAGATATGQLIRAHGALAVLGRSELEAAYEGVSADFVIKDLIGKAGATAGTVDKGPDLASYTLHRGPTALGHLRRLALLCGADLFADGADKVHCIAPKSGGADHSFKFGETVIRLDLARHSPAFDSIEVWGEGAASAQGADKAHWLCTDLSGVSAKAGVDSEGKVQAGKLGERPLRLRDGALRAGDAAEAVAKAWAARLAARLIGGSLELFCAPKVLPGDVVEVTALPDTHSAARLLGQGATLHVRGVRHVLDRRQGATTRLSF